MRGRIKWFNAEKKCGWIVQDDGEEIFLHFSALHFADDHTPAAGEAVEFDVVEGPGGKQAIRVREAQGSGAPKKRG